MILFKIEEILNKLMSFLLNQPPMVSPNTDTMHLALQLRSVVLSQQQELAVWRPATVFCMITQVKMCLKGFCSLVVQAGPLLHFGVFGSTSANPGLNCLLDNVRDLILSTTNWAHCWMICHDENRTFKFDSTTTT